MTLRWGLWTLQVGLFILYNLTAHHDNSLDIGLYRDDDLMVVRNSTNFKIDNIRKLIHKEFKNKLKNKYQYKFKKGKLP